MKTMLLPALLLTAFGCAASTPSTRVQAQPYAIESLEFEGLPPTQLALARETTRADAQQRVLARSDVYDLSSTFATDLRHDLQVADNAPLRLKITVSLHTPGQFEGIAPETTDVSAHVDVLDAQGLVVRTFTVREIANAPLQRSASRRERFEVALSRLSQKVAQHL
jgi:hypothetical protein